MMAAGESDDAADSWKSYISGKLDNPDSGVSYAILGLICLATTSTILETVPELSEYTSLFQLMDYFVTAVFTVELFFRIYIRESCTSFLTNGYNIIDMVAVAPGYLELLLPLWHFDGWDLYGAAGAMRILRLVRLVRVIRVVRLVSEWQMLQQMILLFKVLCEAQTESMAVLLLLAGTTLMAACLIYIFEVPPCLGAEAGTHVQSPYLQPLLTEHCPGGWSDFESIPSAWWWAIISLTTVGYGDVVPNTFLGKLVGGCMCTSGVMLVAIAAAQFSTHFRGRWMQLQVSQKFRQHFAGNDSVVKEQEELEELLFSFQQSLDDLMEKVVCASMEGSGETRETLAPALRSLESHAKSLTGGACSYVYEVLAESMLRQDPDECEEAQRVATEDLEDTHDSAREMQAYAAEKVQEPTKKAEARFEQFQGGATARAGSFHLAMPEDGASIYIPGVPDRLERRLLTS